VLVWYTLKKMKIPLERSPKGKRWRQREEKWYIETVGVARDSVVYIIYDDNSMNLASHDSTSRIIWTRTSHHVTHRRYFFSSYIVDDFDTMKMGNEGVCEIIGMGDICYNM